MKQRIPVTILKGSLGTHDMVFFDGILKILEERRVTAIVSSKDEKALNAKSSASLLSTEPTLKRMGRGCSCCTVRADLLANIKRLADEEGADHIVVKASADEDVERSIKLLLSPTTTALGFVTLPTYKPLSP